MACNCKEDFNRLSKADRMKLQGAAVSKAITGFVRDDTEKNPWRYPFYAAYMLVVATPLPFFGAATLLIGATVLWARNSQSAYAQRINGRLKHAFNDHAKLLCDHREYLDDHPEEPGQKTVRNGALAWHTSKTALNDTWESTKHAARAAKNYMFG